MPSHFTCVADLDNHAVQKIWDRARAIKTKPKKFSKLLDGKILGQMFFEPSTRTYFSFASAAMRGGGNMLGFNGVEWTSMVKGESLEDTARMMANYADILVCRHSDVGTSQHLSQFVQVPIINAGEGAGEHPTQALTDLFTVQQHLGRLAGVRIGIYGDLRFGRTTHSLIRLASRFGMHIICIAPDIFQMPDADIAFAASQGANVKQVDHMTPELLGGLDVIYVTRLQKERLPPGTDMALFDDGIVDAATAKMMPSHGMIMHPLPRVNEIATDVDDDPRAHYFAQAANGVPVRMALMDYLLT